MKPIRLERYDVLANFTLNGDNYIMDSTFMHEDEKVCSILCNGGFIQPRESIEIVYVKQSTKDKKKYLQNLTRGELISVAEDEGVEFYPLGIDLTTEKKFCKYWTKARLTYAIRANRGYDYINGRLTKVR